MKKKIVSMLLLFGLMFTFACSSDTGSATSDDTTAQAVTDGGGEVVTETAEVLRSGVPEDLDLGGESIMIYNAPNYDAFEWMIGGGEETGETVKDALYRRNLNTEEALNVTIDSMFGTNSEQVNHTRSTILAGDDVYDFVIGTQFRYVQLTTEGLFHNLIDVDYIDIEAPWWAADYINTINFGDTARYYLIGDIHLTYLYYLGAVFYNKAIMADFHDDPDLPYDLVLDGKWTIDRFVELSKGLYSDLNGNGESDEEDRFGYATMQNIISEHMFYDMGAHSIYLDSDGTPTLDSDNPRSIDISEKMYSIFHESPESMFMESLMVSIEELMMGKMAANELMFAPGFVYLADFLRDMESDYGIIPYPKYDEAQDDYKTLAHDTVNLTFIPITNDINISAAVIEEMCFQSYMEVSPSYFNVALKGKYMRDGEGPAIEIIDMIRANVFTDIGYVYNYAIDNAGLLIRKLMAPTQSALTTEYAAVEESAKTKLAALVDAYNAMGAK